MASAMESSIDILQQQYQAKQKRYDAEIFMLQKIASEKEAQRVALMRELAKLKSEISENDREMKARDAEYEGLLAQRAIREQDLLDWISRMEPQFHAVIAEKEELQRLGAKTRIDLVLETRKRKEAEAALRQEQDRIDQINHLEASLHASWQQLQHARAKIQEQGGEVEGLHASWRKAEEQLNKALAEKDALVELTKTIQAKHLALLTAKDAKLESLHAQLMQMEADFADQQFMVEDNSESETSSDIESIHPTPFRSLADELGDLLTEKRRWAVSRNDPDIWPETIGSPEASTYTAGLPGMMDGADDSPTEETFRDDPDSWPETVDAAKGSVPTPIAGLSGMMDGASDSPTDESSRNGPNSWPETIDSPIEGSSHNYPNSGPEAVDSVEASVPPSIAGMAGMMDRANESPTEESSRNGPNSWPETIDSPTEESSRNDLDSRPETIDSLVVSKSVAGSAGMMEWAHEAPTEKSSRNSSGNSQETLISPEASIATSMTKSTGMSPDSGRLMHGVIIMVQRYPFSLVILAMFFFLAFIGFRDWWELLEEKNLWVEANTIPPGYHSLFSSPNPAPSLFWQLSWGYKPRWALILHYRIVEWLDGDCWWPIFPEPEWLP
ncbi:MAG: hypothetical protein M1816_001659 [Peltula sp. TS41687]|nr:MAG: hypothetical protein M1816_001659 [Peltula sp. TS41687]